MTPQPETQTIAIHILPYISWRKGNQTMKFGQLVEYDTTNIFLEKSYTEFSGETIPKPFLKNQIWPYLWINGLKIYTVCFYPMPSWGLSQYVETMPKITWFYLKKSFL